MKLPKFFTTGLVLLKHTPLFLRKHYFPVLLAALILFIALGAYIFWDMGIRVTTETPLVTGDVPRIDKEIFIRVSERLQERGSLAPQIFERQYPDIFR